MGERLQWTEEQAGSAASTTDELTCSQCSSSQSRMPNSPAAPHMLSTRNCRDHFTSATTERTVCRKAFLVNWNTLQRVCTVRLPATLHLTLHLVMHILMVLTHAACDNCTK